MTQTRPGQEAAIDVTYEAQKDHLYVRLSPSDADVGDRNRFVPWSPSQNNASK